MDKKTIRILAILALVLTPMLSALVGSAEAAALTSVKDTVSDSGLSANSNHEIRFVATSGVSAAGTITLTFDDTGDAYDLTGVGFADMDLDAGVCSSETSRTLGSTASGATWGVNVNTSTDVITLTSGTDTITAGHCVIIKIGTNASGGTNQINNPSSASVYDLDITSGASDTGKTLLAVLSHVTADVTVDETLTFTVSGIASGACSSRTSDVTTTATSVSFGSVVADTFYEACQGLLVSTNATGGYSVTVQQDGDLTSAGLDTVDAGVCDGTCDISTEDGWATPTNNGFAYCVDDVANTDAVATNPCSDGATAGYRLFGTLGTDTPEVIMSNSGVVSGSEIEVGYQISIDGAQPAGTYSNELIYVATPTY